tara:strand:+ start:4437 stop:5735 length:1299 start_codon:yes stop_codon:yes gene_type:complete
MNNNNYNNYDLVSLYMNICREQISSINHMTSEISSINHNLFTILRENINYNDRNRRNRNRRGARRRFSPRQVPSSPIVSPPPPPPRYPPPPSNLSGTQDIMNNISSFSQENILSDPYTNQRRYTNRIIAPSNTTGSTLNTTNTTGSTLNTTTFQSNLRDIWNNIDNSLSRNNPYRTFTNNQRLGRRRARNTTWNPTRQNLIRNTNWTVNVDTSGNITPILRNNANNFLNMTLQNYDPVRIRPSISQVRRSTRIMLYNELDSSRNQTICPITRENFTPDTSIMQIIPCGHIFSELSLRRHFRFSSRCPLCRYDIRDYHEDSSSDDNNTPENITSTNTTSSISRNFVNNFNSAIGSVIRNSGILESIAEQDSSRNIINNGDSLEIQYSFFLPQNLTESDISGSLVTSSEIYDVSVRLDGSNNVIEYSINDISGN